MKHYTLRSTSMVALFAGLFLAACKPMTLTEVAIYPSPTIYAPTRELTVATPVSDPSATSTPSTTISPTLSDTTTTAPAALSGRLYVWLGGFASTLRILEVSDHGTIQFIQPTSPSVADPAQAVALAFSSNFDQIAYLTYTDEWELHVADLNLTKGATVKLQGPTWLLNKLDRGERISLYWGPSDKTVLIINEEGGDGSIVFAIDENRIEYLSDGCNHFNGADSVDGPALWCRLRQRTDGYLVLQGDGRLRQELALPLIDTLDVKEIAFAHDGKTALLVAGDGRVLLARSNGERVETTIKYAEQHSWRLPRNLNWASDDSLALVYGNSSQCPPFFNEETNQRSERPCWHVIDSQTGSVIWYPTAELASAIDSTWDRISGTDYPAALSPDGTWLALSLREGGLRYLVLTSLRHSHTRVVGNFTASGIIWKP